MLENRGNRDGNIVFGNTNDCKWCNLNSNRVFPKNVEN